MTAPSVIPPVPQWQYKPYEPKEYRPMPQEYYDREQSYRDSLNRQPRYTSCYSVGNRVECVTR